MGNAKPFSENLTRDEEERRFFKGTWNTAIRYYYYLEQGLNELDRFKGLFLAIIALAITLKITSIFWIAAIFFPSIIGLAIVGFVQVHRVSKTKEWIGFRFASHFGQKNYDYQADNNRLLKEINDKLKP